MKEKFPELLKKKEETAEEIREKLKNPEYLPTTAEIKKAFNDLKDKKEWEKFCRGRELKEEVGYYDTDPIYEFLNKEFILALGDYLIKRAKELGVTKEKKLRILELGAGSGRLTHFLEKRVEEKSLEKNTPEIIKIIATDSGHWWRPPYDRLKPRFPVEKLDYLKALKKHNPDIVIMSWTPSRGTDWTGEIRHKESVKEYIIIGPTPETAIGQVGDPWKTWGAYRFDEEKEYKGKMPPYQKDDFERVDLDGISEHQICRMDYPSAKGGIFQHSKTVSFRRKLEK